MILTNVKIIFYDRIERGSVLIVSGKIKEINPKNITLEEIIDGNGLYLAPGFIDIHIHGAGGCDTMEGTYSSINTISKTILNHGTTAFLPTTMTCHIEDIKKAVSAAKEAMDKGTEGAEVLGVHMEGPFINPLMKGAQASEFIEVPHIETFKYIAGRNSSCILSVTLAPEIEGSEELIKYLADRGIVVSAGHSNGSYKQIKESISFGLSHCTHLFNAMTAFTHREPGVVGAVFDSHMTAELICDGVHLSYPAVRIAIKQKSSDKIVLVTDAMMACGMGEGSFLLGGQKVIVKDGSARLENGTLAGSILTMDKAIKNLCENTDYELYEIIRMATCNPARHCGVENRKGLIKEGYDADLVLFDEDINIVKVIKKGVIKD